MFKQTLVNLYKRVNFLKERCRFCERKSYGHRDFIICSDQPRHDQMEWHGVNQGKRGHTPFIEKDQESIDPDPFRRQYVKFGVHQQGDNPAKAISGWSTGNPEFEQQYAWTFNKHRFPSGN